MKRASLIFATAIILIANGLALLRVSRNRTGSPSAEITLTNRELQYFAHSSRDDDSGVTLNLRWMDPNTAFWPAREEAPSKWLDRTKLQALGFDCSLNPADTGAATFYRRQRPRQVFVALEYEGPVWRVWEEAVERSATQPRTLIQLNRSADSRLMGSHLVAIDSDIDSDKLRARHPDRGSVLILPAIVAIEFNPIVDPTDKQEAKSPIRITGRIQELPTRIYVPRPFSDEFRRKHPTSGAGAVTDVVVYRVRLSYGSELEPWITGVEFTDKH